MQYRLRRLAPTSAISFELVSDAGSILPSHHSSVRAIFMRVLEQRGVTLHLGLRRRARGAAALCGFPAAPAWRPMQSSGLPALRHRCGQKSSGLATDDGGFVRVNRRLQSVSHPQVFAAGDIASVAGEPRPKSGVYAVRAGPPLAKNLRRMLRGEPLVEWTPQQDALALITTGDRYAVASRGQPRARGQMGMALEELDRQEVHAEVSKSVNVVPVEGMYSQLPLACPSSRFMSMTCEVEAGPRHRKRVSRAHAPSAPKWKRVPWRQKSFEPSRRR